MSFISRMLIGKSIIEGGGNQTDMRKSALCE